MTPLSSKSRWRKLKVINWNELKDLGSGCGSVGRVVNSDSKGLQFKSSQWQKFIYMEHLFIVNCVLKRRKKEKNPGMAHFFKKKIWLFNFSGYELSHVLSMIVNWFGKPMLTPETTAYSVWPPIYDVFVNKEYFSALYKSFNFYIIEK